MWSRRNFFNLFFYFIPFVFFRLRQQPYFFISSVEGKNWSDMYNKLDQKIYESIDDYMIKENKIIHYQYIPSNDKVFFVYVFDSKRSQKDWAMQHERHNLFLLKNLPGHLQYSQQEGFLNKKTDEFPFVA